MPLPILISPKPSVDIAHHRIHEGNHFMVHKTSIGIAALVPKYFLIIPPHIQPDGSVIEIHLIFEVNSDVGGSIEFFENPIVTANGTPITIINNNRRSSTTSLSEIFEDPTVTNDGILLSQERIGTAAGEVTVGEFERDEEEFVLHPQRTYITKFTPFAVANITTELNWYDNRPNSPIPIT